MPADLTDPPLFDRAGAAPQPAAVWRLHVVASPDPDWRGAILDMSDDGVLRDGTQIGRMPDAPFSLRIDDSTLSRRHASFTKANMLLRVTDLGSSNGTFCAGQRVQAALVGHGAVVRLGSNVFVVERDTGLRTACAEPTADLPGQSERVRQVRGALEDAAHDPLPVLLRGDAGTGKGHAARELHKRSGRPGAFVRVNASAIPESLLDAELFGHAGHGALAARPGRVCEADRGVLMLDELAALPLPQQAKLLQLLDEGTVRAVGGVSDQRLDVRVCASTQVDLAAYARDGRLRSDLLARFHAHVVDLPSLTERRMDLFALADALLPLRDPTGAPAAWSTVLHEETVEALLLYDWPDNLPELAATLVHLRRHIGEQPVPRSVLPSTILRHSTVRPASEETARLRTGPRSLQPKNS